MTRIAITQFQYLKVMEHAIQVQLLTFLDEKESSNSFSIRFPQEAFHSPETAVVYLVDHTLENYDRQQLTGVAFINLKKSPLILLIITASFTS